jgi:hypothetical protein
MFSEDSMKPVGALIVALSLGAAVQSASAAAAASAARAHPDLGGFWELMDDSKDVKPAPLTAAGLEAQRKAQPAVENGEILTYASRWCHPLGVPFIMGDSAPLDIVQSPRETVITAEVQSAARHIYTDGRSHPDPADFDNTTNGHSIGRWEGDTLVVDTVGFSDRGNPSIPGGGARGPGSHLVERYSLIDGGKKLAVQFTWTDPAVFTRPHSYTFTYYRSPPETYALEYFCDASDPNRPLTVVPPPQP